MGLRIEPVRSAKFQKYSDFKLAFNAKLSLFRSAQAPLGHIKAPEKAPRHSNIKFS